MNPLAPLFVYSLLPKMALRALSQPGGVQP
jgi:hypothetical protein